MFKVCTYCHREFELSCFRTRTQHGKTYVVARCKKCEQIVNKQQQDKDRRREKERERFSTKEAKEKKNSFQKEWRAKNIEKNRAYHSKHIKRHVDQITDSYIVRTCFGHGIKAVDIPREIIESYRILIQTKRALKQKSIIE